MRERRKDSRLEAFEGRFHVRRGRRRELLDAYEAGPALQLRGDRRELHLWASCSNLISDMWQMWGCDIWEETEKDVFASFSNLISGIWQMWACDIEEETGKHFFCEFFEFDFGHMANVGVRHLGRDWKTLFWAIVRI